MDLREVVHELEVFRQDARPLSVETWGGIAGERETRSFKTVSEAIEAVRQFLPPRPRLRDSLPPGTEITTPRDRLYTMIAPRQYLNVESHALYRCIKEAQEAVDACRAEAEAKVERAEAELEKELEAVASAFQLFDHSCTNTLDREEVKEMNRYLGFPSGDDDVTEFIKVIDTDGSGSISFPEFEQYVGRMGGSGKLFEKRQQRIKEKCGMSFGATDLQALAPRLDRAGVDAEARAYWRLVAPASEFEAVAELEECQAKAVQRIRLLAKNSHEEALPKLQERLHSLGIPDEQLWLTLAWIRELAPVIVHLNLDRMLQFIEKDTHYRNQFETNSSGGLLKPKIREMWERDLFEGSYEYATPFQRPKYGVQNVMNDHRGVTKCKQYGDSYVTLKDVRLRCTFSPEDSANLKADKLAVPEFYAHVLAEYSNAELTETIKVANSAEAAVIGDSDKVGRMKYKEAQIHGEIAWERNVERLVASTRHRGTPIGAGLPALCKKNGWDFSWMDQEQDRMRKESMHTLGGKAWESRLQALQEGGGDVEVPEGFCRVGCCRRVAPGVTRSGKPFTTCCRGCVMGFGHDRLCGKIDPTKVGPGLCSLGCGRRIAGGRDGKGRRFTTCCRGCATGGVHDEQCQQVIDSVPEGTCRMGCGRSVAIGRTGSGHAYATCCRDCARGEGHTAACDAQAAARLERVAKADTAAAAEAVAPADAAATTETVAKAGAAATPEAVTRADAAATAEALAPADAAVAAETVCKAGAAATPAAVAPADAVASSEAVAPAEPAAAAETVAKAGAAATPEVVAPVDAAATTETVAKAGAATPEAVIRADAAATAEALAPADAAAAAETVGEAGAAATPAAVAPADAVASPEAVAPADAAAAETVVKAGAAATPEVVAPVDAATAAAAAGAAGTAQ